MQSKSKWFDPAVTYEIPRAVRLDGWWLTLKPAAP